MSSYGKFHLLKNNYLNIEEGMNSGNFIKMNKRLFKSYISFILQVLIWKKEILLTNLYLIIRKFAKNKIESLIMT